MISHDAFIQAKSHVTYHDPCKKTHAFPTVRVWYHVTVANRKEGNGNKPHGSQEVTGYFLFVMIPATIKKSTGKRQAQSRLSQCVSMLNMVLCEANRADGGR